jgi:hypothetical protein
MAAGTAYRAMPQASEPVAMDILTAVSDPQLFAPWFRDQATWRAWHAFLAALFALPMTDEQLAIYREHTGRTGPPTTPFNEGWLICGRRAGKSAVLAICAAYLGCFKDYRPYLASGEFATIRIMARDRDQTRNIFRYLSALLSEIPILKRMVVKELAESFELSNRVVLEVGSASFRATRGYTYAAILADELAIWMSDESSNPDIEILRARRPGMLTIPGAMLLCASSPYARRGTMWETYQRSYGKDDPRVLVWKAPTTAMNPTVSQSEIDAEMEKDPANAMAEYMAEFRTDIESFIGIEAVRACITPSLRERPPERQWRYYGFVDPSGGSSDSMTLAVSHKEGATVILDAVREVKPPFSPEATVEEFARLLRQYRCTSAYGDRYAGEWPREQFKRHSINYLPADKSKSDIYLDFLPLVNSGGIDLLDNDRMLHQFVSLERRTSRGGRDSIDHPRGLHDDVANAIARTVVTAAQQPSGWRRDRLPKMPELTIVRRYSGGEPGTNWMSRK